MSKLQLYIYKSMRGFKSLRNINPAENIQRHIPDTRPVLLGLDYDPTEKYMFYLVSYVDEGAFFTILRTIPGEKGDHLSTTIFVPRGLVITAEQMGLVVGRTVQTIAAPSVTADALAELHTTFATEYPCEHDAPATAPSEGRAYAVAHYGAETGRTLDAWFGPMLYQPDYLQFAGVVLVDNELGVNNTFRSADDLPLRTCVPVMPPKPTPEGFAPYIYRRPFDRPFLAPLGGMVEVEWRRQGFESRSQTVEITGTDLKIEPVSTSENRKAISPASFFITSQTTKNQVTDAVVTVNGVEITGPVNFTQSDLKTAEVVVRARGFFTFKGTVDLAATTQALIQLQEQRKTYRFELPVKSSDLGGPIRFEIHSSRPLADSPVEGYEPVDTIKEGPGRVNHLEFAGATGGSSRRMLLIAVVAALVTGMILGWLLAPGADKNPSELAPTDSAALVTETVAQTVAPAASDPAAAAPRSEPAPAVASAGAIKYLDDNAKWTRGRMESYPELRGLFDDMNNYRIDRLTGPWRDKLQKSKNFSTVAAAAEGGRNKPKAKALSGTTYNQPGDTVINWRSYTYKVDP